VYTMRSLPFDMKIATVIHLCMALVFILASAAMVFFVNDSMKRQALVEARAKARLLLDRNMATHTYFSHDLKPSLFRVIDETRRRDYFEPVWMSSTYALRMIDRYFRKLNPSEYYYKDAAISARHPDNEADDDERAYLEALQTNRQLREKAGVRFMDGKPYFVVMRPGEVVDSSCLRCHSTPGQAPGDMVRRYGSERSFHRQAGDMGSIVSIRIPLQEAYGAANRFSVQLSILLTLILCIVFVLQYVIYRRFFLNPMDVVTSKAGAIATDPLLLGDTIAPPPGREWNELVMAFNRMSGSLRHTLDSLEDRVRERTEDLERANDQLTREVRERQRAEEAIRELNEGLETKVRERTAQLTASNRELEAFGYSVSHDLRTPLRAIDGYSQILAEEYDDKALDDTGRSYLERIRRAAGHMGRLIDDLLELARVTRSDFQNETVDLSRLVHTLMEELSRQDPGRTLEFVLQEGILVRGDRRLLGIAMGNLLENAWKFTAGRTPARIEWGMEMQEGRTVCFLRDNGVGFDMAYRAKLFSPFQRLHLSEDFSGTGIGLATVKRVIERHGGEVWAEGIVGQGATFYFALPGSENEKAAP